MTGDDKSNSLLGPLRVLDLTDEKGFLCGKIFADMGADVIKIEKPGGDPSRRIGPFYHDDPDPEKSLYWFAYNTNKRGITLDVETADGQEIFKRMVKTADLIIESFDPGYMGKLGLGYADVEKINKRTIMVSITPFGQTGPYVEQGYKVDDMIVFALSGFMFPNGDPDRPPNQISFPQAYLNGAAEAATAAMIAIYARGTTGEGQYVDLSIQQAMHTCTQMMLPMWDMYKANPPRGLGKGAGNPRPDGTRVSNRSVYECKDGWVYLMVGGGALRAAVLSSTELVKWMDERGMAGDLKGYDWSKRDASKITQKEIDHEQLDLIAPFLKTVTKDEFLQKSIERKILGAPFQDPRDIAESPQLAARRFFVNVEHDELHGTLKYCGPYVQLSETPLNRWRRAPLIGEHNLQIYGGELGLTREQILALKQANVI